MGRNSKPFITLFEQEPKSESYINRIQFLIAKLCSKRSKLTFEAAEGLTAMKVGSDDTKSLPNHSKLTNNESSPFKLASGTTLSFDLSSLPYTLSDQYLSIQHFYDNEGELYRFCSSGVLSSKGTVRHFTLDLLTPSVSVVPKTSASTVKEPKDEKRLKVVNKWMVTKRVELGLDAHDSPQTVHDTLTKSEGRERTQACYWDDWNEIDPVLFPDGADPRNFFNKIYKQIKFSRGNRPLKSNGSE